MKGREAGWEYHLRTAGIVVSILIGFFGLVRSFKALPTEEDILAVREDVAAVERRSAAARAEMASRIARLEDIHLRKEEP